MGNKNNIHVSVYAYMEVEKKKERRESMLTMMIMNCIQKALKNGTS